jgi:phosphate:Na+ symporter
LIRGLSIKTLDVFKEIVSEMQASTKEPNSSDLQAVEAELQREINTVSKSLLILISDSSRQDAGALINFVTFSQRLKDKLNSFAKLHVKAY